MLFKSTAGKILLTLLKTWIMKNYGSHAMQTSILQAYISPHTTYFHISLQKKSLTQ